MTISTQTTRIKEVGLHALLLILLWSILSACSPDSPPVAATSPPTPGLVAGSVVPPAATPVATPTARDDWLAMLRQEPYPYTTPLPPDTPTPLDGLYVKEEPITGTPVPCRRCPDYLSEDGIWKLSLNQGIYHIFHPATGWHSLGSFTVEGNRLYLFNDPVCHLVVGIYTWQLDASGLKLTVVNDPCQVERRADTFGDLTWRSCQPPNTEAAVTDHWPRPSGCDWPPE